MKFGQERSFNSLLEYIQAEMSFETGFYNDAYLDRRITARMRRTGHDEYRNYRDLLAESEEERDALLDSLSINVTSFFRNPEAWEKLRLVLREVTADNRRVEIWSAPCSDGREPYSLAMLALDDHGIDETCIDILGTDINGDILDYAREGVYHTSQTTDIEAELSPLSNYSAYVDREGDTFSVRDEVKRFVTFEEHDLIRGESKADFDVMLCRNLLIYIDAAYKLPVFETIRGSLRSGGILMVGMTETIPSDARDDFAPVYKRQRIYRRT